MQRSIAIISYEKATILSNHSMHLKRYLNGLWNQVLKIIRQASNQFAKRSLKSLDQNVSGGGGGG